PHHQSSSSGLTRGSTPFGEAGSRASKDVDARVKPEHDDCCSERVTAGDRLGRRRQSSGSSLTIEAPWLLPTQKLTGVVRLSTNTRRILVERGSRYSTNPPVLGSSRSTRSLTIEPVQASPLRSSATS